MNDYNKVGVWYNDIADKTESTLAEGEYVITAKTSARHGVAYIEFTYGGDE